MPFTHRDDRLWCEDVPVERIVAVHGTPTYVYSRAALLERYRELEQAFAPLDCLIAYSVKANGNLAVLRVLAEAGAGADIVSGGELYRTRLAGIPAAKTLFSGVGKTVTELAQALEAGLYGFNVESEGELRELAQLGALTGRPAPVALRVNPDVETPTPHAYTRTGHAASKFGIPLEEALSLYRKAARLAGVRVLGIDAHIGSQILDVEPFRRAAERVLELVDTLRRDGIGLEYLDLGGGFGVAYDPADSAPTAADFARVLVPLLRDGGLRLVLEPGRYIAAPAGALLTRVVYVKEMGGKNFVITDAGMNDLFRPSHYAGYHRVEPAVLDPARAEVRVDVVGPICESGDFLALDRLMPRPGSGELLAVMTTGAYGFSMASTYNSRPRPAEVLVEGDDFRLVRRRETYRDLVRGEVELL